MVGLLVSSGIIVFSRLLSCCPVSVSLSLFTNVYVSLSLVA